MALALAVVFVLLERSREQQTESETWVAHTERVLAELSTTYSALTESELAARGRLFSGDQRFAEIQGAADATMRKHLDIVGRLTADNPRQVERIRGLREAAQRKFAASNRLIEIREKQGDTVAIRAFGETAPGLHLEEVRAIIQRMSDEERALLARRVDR